MYDYLTALEFLQKDLHYHYIDMENLDVVTKDELHTHMSDGIKLGTVKPLEARVFNHNELTEAFKYKTNKIDDNVVIQVITHIA